MLKYHIIMNHYTHLEPFCPREQGYCVTANGADQNSGVIKLNSLDGNTWNRQEQCLKLCRSVAGVTGCEVIWDQDSRGCYAHTQEVASGNGVDRHHCWVFSKCEEGYRKYFSNVSHFHPSVLNILWCVK